MIIGSWLRLAAISLVLAGCETTLPKANNGFQGAGQTLTQGSAFGISIGMEYDAVITKLTNSTKFGFKTRACLKPIANLHNDDDLDFSKGVSKTLDCRGLDLQEIWRSDTIGRIYWEVLELNFTQGRLVRIKWWRSRYT